ncbi:MAG: LLM class flavin-dependent oxidoreductase [Acidothermaceae bacterium]
MRVGVAVLPEHPWKAARSIFAHLEDLGFDHAWTYDHLSWRTLRDGPWHAALPLLSAAAASTSRIRLGTLVASPNFRHPVPFAKELMTLDEISGGRFTLGIGAGTTNHDASVLGMPGWSLRERTSRFEEFITLLDTLLTSPTTTFTGQFYSADDARMLPGCTQRPRLPFAIAALGPRGMAIAARFAQTWVTYGDPKSPADTHFVGVKRLVENFEASCLAAGREPASVGRLVLTGSSGPDFFDSVSEFVDAAGRYADLGFTDIVVHYPRAGAPYAGDPRLLDELATALPALR